MTNQATAVSLPTEEQRLREIRGAFVRHALSSERWSARKAAGELNMSHTALSDRFNGNVSFLAEDIADIARLLRRDPVDFYRDFLNASEMRMPDYEFAGSNVTPLFPHIRHPHGHTA